jgi:hypothetical protein
MGAGVADEIRTEHRPERASEVIFCFVSVNNHRPVVGRPHVPLRTSVRRMLFLPNGASQEEESDKVSERKLRGYC